LTTFDDFSLFLKFFQIMIIFVIFWTIFIFGIFWDFFCNLLRFFWNFLRFLIIFVNVLRFLIIFGILHNFSKYLSCNAKHSWTGIFPIAAGSAWRADILPGRSRQRFRKSYSSSFWPNRTRIGKTVSSKNQYGRIFKSTLLLIFSCFTEFTEQTKIIYYQ